MDVLGTSVTEPRERGATMPKPRNRRMMLLEERKKKNRKVIDSYLRHLGNQVGKDLQLGSKGFCYFQYKKFVIVIEIPERSERLYIYTMVLRLEASNDKFSVLQACMELNNMKEGTRGSTLGLEGDEVNLCYSVPISAINRDSFIKELENFIMVALDVNNHLELIR
mmetsp:Transcript_162/g.226  ORF Transcript_162/g.226 Transcript_162/m.226 type:complete len:166 (+) Transcript_162:62-559(+)